MNAGVTTSFSAVTDSTADSDNDIDEIDERNIICSRVVVDGLRWNASPKIISKYQLCSCCVWFLHRSQFHLSIVLIRSLYHTPNNISQRRWLIRSDTWFRQQYQWNRWKKYHLFSGCCGWIEMKCITENHIQIPIMFLLCLWFLHRSRFHLSIILIRSLIILLTT